MFIIFTNQVIKFWKTDEQQYLPGAPSKNGVSLVTYVRLPLDKMNLHVSCWLH